MNFIWRENRLIYMPAVWRLQTYLMHLSANVVIKTHGRLSRHEQKLLLRAEDSLIRSWRYCLMSTLRYVLLLWSAIRINGVRVRWNCRLLYVIDKYTQKRYTFKYSASDEACIAALGKWRWRLGPAQWELRIVSGWEQSSTKQILPCAAGVPGPS